MKALLYVLAVCYIAGLLVIAFQKDYRIEAILESNVDFYPAVDPAE